MFSIISTSFVFVSSLLLVRVVGSVSSWTFNNSLFAFVYSYQLARGLLFILIMCTKGEHMEPQTPLTNTRAYAFIYWNPFQYISKSIEWRDLSLYLVHFPTLAIYVQYGLGSVSFVRSISRTTVAHIRWWATCTYFIKLHCTLYTLSTGWQIIRWHSGMFFFLFWLIRYQNQNGMAVAKWLFQYNQNCQQLCFHFIRKYNTWPIRYWEQRENTTQSQTRTHSKQNIIVDCVLFYAPILNTSRTLKCLSLSSDSTHLMIAVLLLLVPLLLLLLSALFSVICRFLTVGQLKCILFGMLFFRIFFRFVHLPFFLVFWTLALGNEYVHVVGI